MSSPEGKCFHAAMNIGWAWARAREDITLAHYAAIPRGKAQDMEEDARLKRHALADLDELEQRIREQSKPNSYSGCPEVVKDWFSERKLRDLKEARKSIEEGHYSAAYDEVGDLL